MGRGTGSRPTAWQAGAQRSTRHICQAFLSQASPLVVVQQERVGQGSADRQVKFTHLTGPATGAVGPRGAARLSGLHSIRPRLPLAGSTIVFSRTSEKRSPANLPWSKAAYASNDTISASRRRRAAACRAPAARTGRACAARWPRRRWPSLEGRASTGRRVLFFFSQAARAARAPRGLKPSFTWLAASRTRPRQADALLLVHLHPYAIAAELICSSEPDRVRILPGRGKGCARLASGQRGTARPR